MGSKEVKSKEGKNKEKSSKAKEEKKAKAKEVEAKEARSKEVAKKERANKERNSKEKKAKEVRSKQEKVMKEKRPKELKAKELVKKEKTTKENKVKERKKKEGISKEARSKEAASKERTNKAGEKRSKEARSKEASTKERSSKSEKQNKAEKIVKEKVQKTKKPNFKEMAACITAAHASIKDVVKEVKNDQAMLDAMLDGSQCTSKACRCRVAKVAAKQFKIAVSLQKAREATIVRETKVICVDNAMKKGSKAAADRCKNLTINDLTMAKYKPQLVLRPKRLAKGVSLAECKATIKPTIKPVAPADPCKKWKAEHKANAEIAKALKAEVKFGGGSTKLKDQGKKTLDNVAKILNKYPWMTITVEGHSDAPKGARCTALTIGRAAETEKYLKSKGVKNKMTRPIGKCGKKRAIEIIGNAAGRKAAPKGCGLRGEEDELVQDFSEAWSSVN